MATKLTELEEVIDKLENQVDAIHGFKNVLAKIEKLNDNTLSVRDNVDGSAKILKNITEALELGIKKNEVTADAFKAEIEKFRAIYDSFNNKNRDFETQLIDKLSSLGSDVHSSLKSSSEDVRKELQALGVTINSINKETIKQNVKFEEKILEKITSVESFVELGFKSLANEQARSLKLTTIFIVLLIIVSTAISYFF